MSVYLRLAQFPVSSDRPPSTRGPRRPVTISSQAIPKRSEEPSADLLLLTKIYFSGAQMDEISLRISSSDCFSFLPFCVC